MSIHQKGKTKRGKVHCQFVCGVRQRVYGGGGYDKYQEVAVDRSSPAFDGLLARLAEIDRQLQARLLTLTQ